MTYPAIPVTFTLCPWEDHCAAEACGCPEAQEAAFYILESSLQRHSVLAIKQQAVKHGANHSVWGFDMDSGGHFKNEIKFAFQRNTIPVSPG